MQRKGMHHYEKPNLGSRQFDSKLINHSVKTLYASQANYMIP